MMAEKSRKNHSLNHNKTQRAASLIEYALFTVLCIVVLLVFGQTVFLAQTKSFYSNNNQTYNTMGAQPYVTAAPTP
jgi:Flp pilus assembly pilin Flp